MSTLRASQRRQTEMTPPNGYTGARQHSQTRVASPDGYAYGTSAQPNGEDIAKRLRSEPVNVTKRRSHPQTTTLRPIRSSPLFPSSPSLFPALGVAKRRWHHRMPTLRTPQRSQTGTAPPNGYTQNPSNVAIRGRHHQTATLRTPQRSHTGTASPNDYAERTGGDVESSHSCPAPNCLIRSTTPVIPAICNPTPITREIPPATRQSALCNPLRYADEWYETAHNTRGSIERRNENVRTYQWH